MSGLLLEWLAGIGEMVQAVDNLSTPQIVNGELAPGWSQALDVNRCPTYALPWLGQFVGVRVDPMQRDDIQRHTIMNVAGFSRGTPAAILAAADLYLLPGYSATLSERDTSPYHLSIDIPAAGVVGDATCAILAAAYQTCADLIVAFPTCADLWSATDAITTAIDAAVPAGLVVDISFV